MNMLSDINRDFSWMNIVYLHLQSSKANLAFRRYAKCVCQITFFRCDPNTRRSPTRLYALGRRRCSFLWYRPTLFDGCLKNAKLRPPRWKQFSFASRARVIPTLKCGQCLYFSPLSFHLFWRGRVFVVVAAQMVRKWAAPLKFKRFIYIWTGSARNNLTASNKRKERRAAKKMIRSHLWGCYRALSLFVGPVRAHTIKKRTRLLCAR